MRNEQWNREWIETVKRKWVNEISGLSWKIEAVEKKIQENDWWLFRINY